MSPSIGDIIVTVIFAAALAASAYLFRSPPIQSNSHNEVPRCLICIEQLQTGQAQQELPCGHVFHKKCISVVLKEEVRPSCPYCRKIFSPGEAAQ